MDKAEENRKKALDLVKKGGNPITSILGSLVGYYVGDASGAVVAPTTTAFLQILFAAAADQGDRLASKKEIQKMGACSAYILRDIKDRLENNELPRDDYFYKVGDGDEYIAELFDGIVTKCRLEYQIAKIEHISKILTNFAFNKELSDSEVSHYLNLIERLTYRQLIVIGILYLRQSFGEDIQLRVPNYRENISSLDLSDISLLQEVFQLANEGILGNYSRGDDEGVALLTWADLEPQHLKLTGLGLSFAKYTGAESVDRDKLKEVCNQLKK